MAGTGPGLGDVVDMAMKRHRRRSIIDVSFGAAGHPGDSVDDDFGYAIRKSRTSSHVPEETSSDQSPDPMTRMFGTELGRRAASEIGNESATIEALRRLSMEIVAEAMRLSGQVGDDDRVLVMPGESDQPPVLMILSPQMADAGESRVISRDLNLPLDILTAALDRVADADDQTPEAMAFRQLLNGGPGALAELFLIAQPEVVLSRRPNMVRLCVPSPHERVECGGEISTAGVLCYDQDGEFGVTACFHGTGPAGTAVRVGPYTATVKRASPIQDTVFIPLTDPASFPNLIGKAGVLADREPARADIARFDGATNQNSRTRIFSTDAGLLRTRPTIMLKLQTDPDTDRGDSGCALLDDSERVLGFAFERTSFDDYPQFTDWIWAANALRALDLTPYK